jgi:hypothetical protein
MQAAWADGPGRESVERLYAASAGLSGDAVVIFFRALCAVSQEELAPADALEPARCAYSGCAYSGRCSDVLLSDLGHGCQIKGLHACFEDWQSCWQGVTWLACVHGIRRSACCNITAHCGCHPPCAD